MDALTELMKLDESHLQEFTRIL